MVEIQSLKPSHAIIRQVVPIIQEVSQVMEAVDFLLHRLGLMRLKYHRRPRFHHMERVALFSRECHTSSRHILKPIRTSVSLLHLP
jgi:hypothetical protein